MREPRPCSQKMADLLEDRVTVGIRAFWNIGNNCFDPLALKGRKTKWRHGWLFTCLVMSHPYWNRWVTRDWLRCLRSSSYFPLDLPRSKTAAFGDRAFSIAGPLLWNAIPPGIKKSPSVAIFKKSLKTYFFNQLNDSWEPIKAIRALRNIIWILALYKCLHYYIIIIYIITSSMFSTG